MATVHQLKVTIMGIKPPVWRRVVVPSRSTLAELHDVVQAAFEWWGYHLHDFDIRGVRYGSEDGEDWDPPKDERRARLPVPDLPDLHRWPACATAGRLRRRVGLPEHAGRVVRPLRRGACLDAGVGGRRVRSRGVRPLRIRLQP